jgi:hypothetical protein
MTEFASFLRCERDYQQYFQICRDCHGQAQFMKAETLFHYEHGSPYKIADKTHEKLLAEVSDEDFVRYEIPGRVRCDALDDFLCEHKIDLRDPHGREALRRFLDPAVPEARRFVEKLTEFLHIQARLPSQEKNFSRKASLEISAEMTRAEIVDYLTSKRKSNPTADLAFYAFRDMDTCDWRPFAKAAVERCPVSLQMASSLSIEEAYQWLQGLDDASIYDGNRLAQPDEVANYGTGDGLEKAFTLANILRHKSPKEDCTLKVHKSSVTLKGSQTFEFTSAKRLQHRVTFHADGTITARR